MLAALEDEAVVGEGEGAVDVLFDHYYGDAVLAGLVESVEYGVDEFGGEAEGHFVGDEEVGLGGEGAGEGEHLLFAAGEEAAELAAAAGEDGEGGEGLVEGGLAVLAGEVVDGHAEVVDDGEFSEDASAFG